MDEWEELLRRHGGQKEQPRQQEDAGARAAGSLIQQVRELGMQTGAGASAAADDADDETQESVPLPDGYVRLTPVQRYRTPVDYTRRIVRKVILIIVGVGLVALLALALVKSGLLRFR